jgi:hypothetical protein
MHRNVHRNNVALKLKRLRSQTKDPNKQQPVMYSVGRKMAYYPAILVALVGDSEV